jgi:hypothetical protein
MCCPKAWAPPVDVIKLPTAALRQEGGQSAVWVYDPQTRR